MRQKLHLNEVLSLLLLFGMKHVLGLEQVLWIVVMLRVLQAYEIVESNPDAILDVLEYEVIGALVLAELILSNQAPHASIFGGHFELLPDVFFLIQISVIKLEPD